MKKIDLVGKKFGKLTVSRYLFTDKRYRAIWECVCECGRLKQTCSELLLKGKTKSCGCLYKENAKILANKRNNKGKSKTRLYITYYSIKSRCYNPKNSCYYLYGERGITMCEEWLGLNGFKNFEKWALDNGYNNSLNFGECTIDRINTNKGYSPDNCRLVNLKIQNNNKRTNRYITYNNETKTLSQWAETYNMSKETLTYRLDKAKWSLHKSLNEPIKIIRRKNDKPKNKND